MRKELNFLVILAFGLVSSSSIAAESYPTRPIRFVVPFVAGGGTDLIARMLGKKFTEAWGQPVVVDNRPGGAGAVGSLLVAQSAPDGYTLILVTSSTHAIAPNFHRKPPFDPVKDFTAIAQVASAPEIIFAHPSVPVNSIKELVALAKAKPGTLNYASPGAGTIGNMTGEMFNLAAGLKIVHVPYKGSAAAMRELLGGQVQIMFSGPGGALPHVHSGKLKALAALTRTRLPELKDIPTLAESGYPSVEASNWYGVLTTAGTPKAVITKIHGEIVRIMQMPEISEMLLRYGYYTTITAPAEMAKLVKDELAKWSKVVKASGMPIN